MKGAYPFKAAVLDTMLLIYLFEDAPHQAVRCERLFEAVRRGAFRGIVTPITLAEIIVRPLRANRSDIADRYRAAVSSFPNLLTCSITPSTAAMAGALRGKYDHPLPDLFQVACAMEHSAVLLTNDKGLRKITEIPVILLDSEFFNA